MLLARSAHLISFLAGIFYHFFLELNVNVERSLTVCCIYLPFHLHYDDVCIIKHDKISKSYQNHDANSNYFHLSRAMRKCALCHRQTQRRSLNSAFVVRC